jgi:outer membrane cobalamin receptor
LFTLLAHSLAQVAIAEQPHKDDQNITLEPIVVTASKIPTKPEEVTSDVTVITKEEIERIKPNSVADLLQQAPGVYIDQQSSQGGLSSVYIRGSDPNYTMILIDGVQMNDPTNARGGSFDISTLSVANIERIEIVKGPVSSVYGSAAMAGAINIITVQGKSDREISVEAGAGSFGDYRGNFQIRGPASDYTEYAITAAYIDNGEPIEGDSYSGGDITAKVNVYPTEKSDLIGTLRFHDSRSESYPDDSGGPEYAEIREVDKRDTRETTAALAFNQELSSNTELKLIGSWLNRQEEFESPGVAPGIRDPFGIPPNESDSEFNRGQLSANLLFTPGKQFTSTIGIDAELEKGQSDFTIIIFDSPVGDQFEMDRDTYSPYVEAQFFFDWGLNISAGLRVDITDDYDTEYSPRIGVLYRINATSTTLKANYGQGFKLPSYFALSNPIVGNPDLLPEKSEGFDIIASQELFGQSTTLDIIPFYNKFYDLIDLDSGPPPQLINRSEVETSGVEMSLSIKPVSNFMLGVHATYTKTNIIGSDEELLNSPEWIGGAVINWMPTTKWNVNFKGNYVSERLDSSIPTDEVALDAYTRFDLAVTWKPKSMIDLTFAVDNIFDEEYEEAVGFPAPGTHYKILAKLTF